MMRLRPAQKEALEYRGGRMAISAVPGSGKTTTLSLLAANLVSKGQAGQRSKSPASMAGALLYPGLRKVAEAWPDHDHLEQPQILVVTFSNAAVANFRSRIANHLQEKGRPRLAGYDVRTLHSLAHFIVGQHPALAGLESEYRVLDGGERESLLGEAIRVWERRRGDWWQPLAQRNDDVTRRQWQRVFRGIVHTTIRTAKMARAEPDAIIRHLADLNEIPEVSLSRMGAEVYKIYQEHLERRGAVDFDDLVWKGYELLRDHPLLLESYRRRWPYILEDEAQDSSPLQEEMLELLVGPAGNWVRVGDPNQAINATFTAADPRFFRRFCQRENVRLVELVQSGRSSKKLISLANNLIAWVCSQYPERELRRRAFARQMIRPVDEEDPQGNTPDEESAIDLGREYATWGDELDDVVRKAIRYTQRFPHHTLSILIPTNVLGNELSRRLRQGGVEFDELLRTTSGARSVLRLLWRLLDFASEPTSKTRLRELFSDLAEAGLLMLPQGCNIEHVARLLDSAISLERLLNPEPGTERSDELPVVERTSQADIIAVDWFSEGAARWLRASALPVDEFILTVASELFRSQYELAVAQFTAAQMRRVADDDPTLNLPALARELKALAFTDQGLSRMGRGDLGFEPQPGRITLATMHGAKGLEWDLVYLLGVDKSWFPEMPDDCWCRGMGVLDGDLQSEVGALVRSLVTDSPAFPSRYPPTREAQYEQIAERLRLLYVGITRARRHLCISWSQERLLETRRDPMKVEIAPMLSRLREMLADRLVQAVPPGECTGEETDEKRTNERERGYSDDHR